MTVVAGCFDDAMREPVIGFVEIARISLFFFFTSATSSGWIAANAERHTVSIVAPKIGVIEDSTGKERTAVLACNVQSSSSTNRDVTQFTLERLSFNQGANLMATNKVEDETLEELRNEDPITHQAGAHPVGSGVGAALGGAATGAVAGLAAGPVGAVAGAIIGGVAGGLAGKAVAESYDPTVEAAYWQNEYRNRPYYNKAHSYNHYSPAYRAGWEAYDADANEDWETREATARQGWENEGGADYMTWDEARPAAKDAYSRVDDSRKNFKPR